LTRALPLRQGGGEPPWAYFLLFKPFLAQESQKKIFPKKIGPQRLVSRIAFFGPFWGDLLRGISGGEPITKIKKSPLKLFFNKKKKICFPLGGGGLSPTGGGLTFLSWL